MCLALFKPVGHKVPVNNLISGYKINSHSMGMMWAHDGVLHIHKQMNDIDSFIAKYLELELMDLPIAVHFRFATHGAKNLENCHPFSISDKIAIVHNGVFHGLGTSKKSDTWEFADLLTGVGVDTIFDNTMLQLLVEQACGFENKVVFLNNEGKHFIANEKSGTWKQGIWYSNTYSLHYEEPSYSYKKKGKKGRLLVSASERIFGLFL